MGSNSRYDRYRPVDDTEADEARALHAIARLVDDYPGVTAQPVRSALTNVLDACAIELNAGRVVSSPVRLAVRRLADEIRRELDPLGRG